jgi:hypothetical protein
VDDSLRHTLVARIANRNEVDNRKLHEIWQKWNANADHARRGIVDVVVVLGTTYTRRIYKRGRGVRPVELFWTCSTILSSCRKKMSSIYLIHLMRS